MAKRLLHDSALQSNHILDAALCRHTRRTTRQRHHCIEFTSSAYLGPELRGRTKTGRQGQQYSGLREVMNPGCFAQLSISLITL